jgi:putative ABC transport system ATP-binding protein
VGGNLDSRAPGRGARATLPRVPPDPAAALLEAANLSRSYGLGAAVVPAVRGVSLSIRAGEFVALKGPSGSGKTTLLNLLGLLDRPDAGTVRIDGTDGEAMSEDARSDLRRDRFGFVFQTFNLMPVLTAEENVGYPLALSGVDPAGRRARARELLTSVGLSDKFGVRPDLLSGGQRQRVAIARALANRPAVVFADEPTANLDSRTAEEILDLMRDINAAQRVAFLFATHDPRVVARARRIVTLHDGQIESDVAA